MQHVKLYVNDWTLKLGSVGASALQQLSQRAKAVGLISADTPNIEVFAS